MNKNLTFIIIKIAAASGIAWELAKWLGSKHPFLAPLSVILCIQGKIDKSIQYSWFRLFGTVLGVLGAALVGKYFTVTGFSIALFLFIGLWLSKWLKANVVFLHEVALSILLVFYFVHETKQYAVDRVRDTLIGVALAALVHIFIFPPNVTSEANHSVINFMTKLSDHFNKMLEWIHGGCSKQEGLTLKEEISQSLTALHKTSKDINNTISSLKFNPFSDKKRMQLQQLHNILNQTKKGYSYLENVVGTILIWSSSGEMTAMDQLLWANQIDLIRTYFENRKRELETGAWPQNQPQIAMQVSLPNGLEEQQYNVALYHSTSKFIQEIKTV